MVSFVEIVHLINIPYWLCFHIIQFISSNVIIRCVKFSVLESLDTVGGQGSAQLYQYNLITNTNDKRLWDKIEDR